MSNEIITEVVEATEKAVGNTKVKVAIVAASVLVGVGLVLVAKARAKKKAELLETEPIEEIQDGPVPGPAPKA